jgi:hypothetical protein
MIWGLTAGRGSLHNCQAMIAGSSRYRLPVTVLVRPMIWRI